MIPDIERVTAAGYVAGIDAFPIEDIRQRRDECRDLENAVSYVRRFAQARLDLVAGPEGPKGPSELSASLSSHSGPTTARPQADSYARPPQNLEPNSFADQLSAVLDEVVAPSKLMNSAGIDDTERHQMVLVLGEFEQQISQVRQQLHDVISLLMTELVRRYRDGDASVDSLLA